MKSPKLRIKKSFTEATYNVDSIPEAVEAVRELGVYKTVLANLRVGGEDVTERLFAVVSRLLRPGERLAVAGKLTQAERDGAHIGNSRSWKPDRRENTAVYTTPRRRRQASQIKVRITTDTRACDSREKREGEGYLNSIPPRYRENYRYRGRGRSRRHEVYKAGRLVAPRRHDRATPGGQSTASLAPRRSSPFLTLRVHFSAFCCLLGGAVRALQFCLFRSRPSREIQHDPRRGKRTQLRLDVRRNKNKTIKGSKRGMIGNKIVYLEEDDARMKLLCADNIQNSDIELSGGIGDTPRKIFKETPGGLRPTTPQKKTVTYLLYSNFSGCAATKYGIANELFAIAQLQEQLGKGNRACWPICNSFTPSVAALMNIVEDSLKRHGSSHAVNANKLRRADVELQGCFRVIYWLCDQGRCSVRWKGGMVARLPTEAVTKMRYGRRESANLLARLGAPPNVGPVARAIVPRLMKIDYAVHYPVEFIRSMYFSAPSPHKFLLKVGAPLVLARKLNPPERSNSTRLHAPEGVAERCYRVHSHHWICRWRRRGEGMRFHTTYITNAIRAKGSYRQPTQGLDSKSCTAEVESSDTNLQVGSFRIGEELQHITREGEGARSVVEGSEPRNGVFLVCRRREADAESEGTDQQLSPGVSWRRKETLICPSPTYSYSIVLVLIVLIIIKGK
ncbi:hypothetical protein PR048_005587 [Dryococelus australis]|uniref:Uncharacterized protein n=1 Tax=Dryococelus australis TaxID=614101 RepID=A0ABQ9I8N5_9NEOP|nr:hypothetical protein PR048_005587 [Dryococelus australis]